MDAQQSESGQTNADPLARIVPYRPERYGLSDRDFDDARIIDVRLAMNRDESGRFAFSPEQTMLGDEQRHLRDADGNPVSNAEVALVIVDEAILELFPEDEALARWIRKAQDQVAYQGLPARICWLGYGERQRAGLAFNELVRGGALSAPIVIGRDHLDSGSVASPNRETEGMKDGSDAIADWPILNALLNTASGAAWVAVHHGGIDHFRLEHGYGFFQHLRLAGSRRGGVVAVRCACRGDQRQRDEQQENEPRSFHDGLLPSPAQEDRRPYARPSEPYSRSFGRSRRCGPTTSR